MKPDAQHGLSEKPIRVLVDLRGLESTGINGGLQTYATWLIPWIIHHYREKFVFLALARISNVEIAASLLGAEDAVLVVADFNQEVNRSNLKSPTVVVCSTPIPQLIVHLGIECIYSPLGGLPCVPPDGVRAISLVADMLHMEMPMSLEYPIVRERSRNLEMLVKHATWVQCISHSSESRLLHHVPALKERTFFSYLPIHARFKRQNFISKGDQTRPYFLYCANYWPHKNHLALILGYNLYLKQTSEEPWDLVLTGADYKGGLGRVRNLVQALAIADRVRFTGYVSDDEMSQYWIDAGALVFPSLHEGFGIPLLEAMHYRVPILTSPNYSLTEIAGDAALYFNPMKPSQISDRMVEITSSPELRARLCDAGIRRLSQFSDKDEADLVVAALAGITPCRQPSQLHTVCGCPI